MKLIRRLKLLAFASSLIACGGGHDATAKIDFTLPNGKFSAIEAVTAFPAKLDPQDGHVIARVCGAPLGPDDPGADEANGFEVTANFWSTSVGQWACVHDPVNSVKEGEIVDEIPVVAGLQGTVTPTNFNFTLRQLGLPDDSTAAVPAPTALVATAVRYANIVDRCDAAQNEATPINLALIIDNSGSTKGNVDQKMLKEDADGYYDPPPPPLTNVASDWYGARFNAANNFIENLNTKDRVVGYVFDESGPHVAASDSFICTGTGNPSLDNAPCRPEDSSSCPSPGTCDPDPTQTNDNYNVALAEGECLAFGSDISKRNDLENGIALKQNAASGRGSLWKTVDNAFQFLSGGGANCPNGSFGPLGAMHIVILTDGPDTCVDSDEFSYMSLKNADTSGKCRTKCATSDVKWKELLVKMAKLKYPIHVHFVQFQAPGYLEPDPRMIEMACRTDGTYQFINSENFNKSWPGDFSNALVRAVERIRGGLSGTWRVGFRWPTGQAQPLSVGQLRSLDGDFMFTDNNFPSLAFAVNTLLPDGWRFEFSGYEDRRPRLLRACANDAACGASDPCALHHCGEGGVCAQGAAPEGRPCDLAGQSGRCRAGACAAGLTCEQAIAK